MHKIALMVAVVMAVMVAVVIAWIRFETIGPDRESTPESPVILDINAHMCLLSPNGTYLAAAIDRPNAVYTLSVYDLRTNQSVPLPSIIDQEILIHHTIWLDDETWFVSTEPEVEQYPHEPTNGWIINIKTQTVTDVLSLDPAEQTQILDTARLLFAEEHAVSMSNKLIPSPDGNYTVNKDAVIFDRNNQITNQPPFKAKDVGLCTPGWKADSAGVYYVLQLDKTVGVEPGPIRFLPVTPPK